MCIQYNFIYTYSPNFTEEKSLRGKIHYENNLLISLSNKIFQKRNLIFWCFEEKKKKRDKIKKSFSDKMIKSVFHHTNILFRQKYVHVECYKLQFNIQNKLHIRQRRRHKTVSGFMNVISFIWLLFSFYFLFLLHFLSIFLSGVASLLFYIPL